ncbi:hypothetical protein WDJ51_01040 [Rathayibacter sp. YIM 133350]|uniref:hypothetical protein n=1 Tax=Rathayibacter sp. YIM 133350 TaxID=3131992 RepID=UPI00307CE04E
MELVATPRVRFLRGLADEILQNYGRGRVIIAIDGALRSGKSEFGDDLAAVFAERGHPAFRASLEHFHRTRQAQAGFGPDTAERYFRYGFDYSLLRRVLIDPFRLAGSAGFVTAAFDPSRDKPIEPKWQTGPADAALIIDGRFINRPELRGAWNWSLWIDGGTPDEADDLYHRDDDPRAVATAVVDNSVPERPRRLFLDSC